MNKLLTLLVLIGILALAANASQPSTKAVNPKLEIQSLTDQILAQKGAGQTPDPTLYSRLQELQGRRTSAAHSLDTGADACPATVITSVPFTDSSTTAGATDDFGGYSCNQGTGADVIYQYTPTTTGFHTISLCGSSFDTGLEVRIGDACPGNTEVACNDDYCSLGSQLDATLIGGTTYYIIVDGCCGGSGDYVLTISALTVNPGETCANAFALTIPGTVTGTTVGYINDYDQSCPYTGGTAPDVVYSYTPAADQLVSFDLCLSNWDTKLYLFDGSCTGTAIACNDDYCPDFQSFLSCVRLYAGHTYYIVVDGYSAFSGAYTLVTTVCAPECAVGEPQDGRVCIAGGPLADGTLNFFTVPVLEQYHITDVNVSFTAHHTYPRDFVIQVVSPMGSVAMLTSHDVDGMDFICTTFDDEAENPLDSLVPSPHTGTFLPETPLAVFDNQNAAGNWVIAFIDEWAGDYGVLDWLCLSFTYDYVLAVELASFSAIPGDSRVRLTWRTASETSNDYFEVVRDGDVVAQVDATNLPTGASYSWVDEAVTNGVSYSYTLVAIDNRGARSTLQTVAATPAATVSVATDYALYQNYPNPFNPTTEIRFNLPDATQVELKVFNMVGQLVTTLVDGVRPAGVYTVQWNGKDVNGMPVPTGTYIYQLQAGSFTDTKKMLLLK